MLTEEQILEARKRAGIPEGGIASPPNPGVANVARRRQLAAEYDAQKAQEAEQNKPGFLNRHVDILKERGKQVIENIKQIGRGEINPLEFGVRTVGTAAGAVNDEIGNVLQSAGGMLSEEVKSPIKQVGVEILQSPLGQAGISAIQKGSEIYSEWKKNNPRAAADIEAVVNIASLLPVGKGGQVGKELAETGAKNVAKISAQTIEPVLDTAKNVGKGLKTVGGVIREQAQVAKQIPGRVATNVAEKAIQKQAIDALPTEVAKKAVRNGIDIADVNTLHSIEPKEKSVVKKLFDTAKQFSEKKGTTNPIEVVGQSIRERLKSVDTLRKSIGQKLGEEAKNLGTFDSGKLVDPVLNKLKSVPGLENVEISSKGLNFKNTNLASSLSKTDQKAINDAFINAIKPGTGTQKHLFRQELFEILGGKKKAAIALTDTQEKAFEAIREGLSDALGSKNPLYKKLSADYREAIQPIKELRKFLKITDVDDDILDMSAGLLARRLTSYAPTGQDIKKALRGLENVMTKYKKTPEIDVSKLQDIYNVLNRYYNITGETSFAGQVRTGVESVGGLKEMAGQALKATVGQSEAVKRKALEDVMSEILK